MSFLLPANKATSRVRTRTSTSKRRMPHTISRVCTYAKHAYGLSSANSLMIWTNTSTLPQARPSLRRVASTQASVCRCISNLTTKSVPKNSKTACATNTRVRHLISPKAQMQVHGIANCAMVHWASNWIRCNIGSSVLSPPNRRVGHLSHRCVAMSRLMQEVSCGLVWMMQLLRSMCLCIAPSLLYQSASKRAMAICTPIRLHRHGGHTIL